MASNVEQNNSQLTEKKGIFHEIKNAAQQLTSASIGAVTGAALGLVIPIPGATLAGAAIGGILGRGVEAGLNFFMKTEDGAKSSENANKKTKNTPIVQENPISNTAQMTLKLGGKKSGISKTAEAEVTKITSMAPTPKPGAVAAENAAVLDTAVSPLVVDSKSSPTAASIFNPAGIPTLRAGGGASAA